MFIGEAEDANTTSPTRGTGSLGRWVGGTPPDWSMR